MNKIQINSKKQRLGELISVREGTKFQDVFVDGMELRECKTNLVFLIYW